MKRTLITAGKELQISPSTLRSYLISHGHSLSSKPNAEISEAMYNLLLFKYRKSENQKKNWIPGMNSNHLLQKYYNEVITQLLITYDTIFSSADKGHCMKLAGIPMQFLDLLRSSLVAKHPHIDIFIIADQTDTEGYISATKLIELRNSNEKALLAIIPPNSHTAAEDSYGNATFQNISLSKINDALAKRLFESLPASVHSQVKEVLQYLGLKVSRPTMGVINYLLALDDEGSNESIGLSLRHLDLLPDKQLLDSKDRLRSRLNYNNKCLTQLCDFSKAIYVRLRELPIEKNTIQEDLVELIRNHPEANNRESIVNLIAALYPKLDFSEWKIPEIDPSQIKIFIDSVKHNQVLLTNFGSNADDDNGVLRMNPNSSTKIKVTFHSNPTPTEIPKLAYFRVALCSSEDFTEVLELKRFKNSKAKSNTRSKSIELHSNNLDEGNYYIKVEALDNDNNIINGEDDYNDPSVQEEYDELSDADKVAYAQANNYKKTSDSDNFMLSIEDIEEQVKTSKAKLHNVREAFYRFRIDDLKNNKEIENPTINLGESTWQEAKIRQLTSTYIVKYSNRHHYQIILSKKLKDIQQEFINNSMKLGHCKVVLSSDPKKSGLSSCVIQESLFTKFATPQFLQARAALFSAIASNSEVGDGIIESFEFHNNVDLVVAYLNEYQKIIAEIKDPLRDISDDPHKKIENIVPLTQAVLSFDVAFVESKLPNQSPVKIALLSPLHPLRLYWALLQHNTFLNWESKTKDLPSRISEWKDGLDNLFLSELVPNMNPTFMFNPETKKDFLLAGDLCYGWSLYTEILQTNSGPSINNSQILSYFRYLLNIDKSQYTDYGYITKLVARSLKNYVKQHPYVEKLVVNVINSGEAYPLADALVLLEKDVQLQNINYEIRLIEDVNRLVNSGEGLRQLLNPSSILTEEAESFSQVSKNSLFPKLRYSLNTKDDLLGNQNRYASHVTFLMQPFPLTVSLVDPNSMDKSFYANGLICNPESKLVEKAGEYTWYNYVKSSYPDYTAKLDDKAQECFHILQYISAFSLAKRDTSALPSAKLQLSKSDSVFISVLHKLSDWVVTVDNNFGPEVFDLKSEGVDIPFLLDYIPGRDIGTVSSFLTTHPTSEINGFLKPHLSVLEKSIGAKLDDDISKVVLEDIRSVSSSLLMQLNQSKNQAIEVIGIALAKRVLNKKGLLHENIVIPIDLHKELFVSKNDKDSSERADLLLCSIDPEKDVIKFTILEVKCRQTLTPQLDEALKDKMRNQIDNTEFVLRKHFDPDLGLSEDRLDRKFKNYQLRNILQFYLARSKRFDLVDDTRFDLYSDFINRLDDGYTLKFSKLGFIFNYSEHIRHKKEKLFEDTTFFTFGAKIIPDILSDMDNIETYRYETNDDELKDYFKPVELSEELRNLRNNIIKDRSKVTEDTSEPSDSSPDTPSPARPTNKKVDTSSPQAHITTVVEPTTEKEQLPADEPITVPDVTNAPDNDQQPSDPVVPSNIPEVYPPVTEPVVAAKPRHEVSDFVPPEYSMIIGTNSHSEQYGILGATMQGSKVAIDLNETSTISLFGVQGGGKSYSIGSVVEMVLKPFQNVNSLQSPMAGVIFHYSESMDYEPEFTSMIFENDQERELQILKDMYGADPDSIDDIVMLVPSDKIEERRSEFPSIDIHPIGFSSSELDVKSWMFLLGAINNDSTYIKQLKSIMKKNRSNLSLQSIRDAVEESEQLSNSQRNLANQRLDFAADYINDDADLSSLIKPGRLVIVDLRDEFIDKDEALGLFVIMLNIFSSDKEMSKFIVFDEAHKYMDNKALAGKIVEAIREMRHKGVSLMIASQDPPSLPNEIIELSSIVITHKFNSPGWLKHIQKSITNLNVLQPSDMSSLGTGEAFLWSSKSTDKSITQKPKKIRIRPRVTKHGGCTIKATDH